MKTKLPFKTYLALSAAAVLASSAAYPETQHYYIISDSLSSPTGCEWVKQLDGAIHNYAQAGLTLAAFDLPRHFRAEPGSKAVIYIGTNDAGSGYKVSDFREQLRELVTTLRSRGMAHIYIVAQPHLDIHESAITSFREATREIAQEVAATYLDPGWGSESTIDGVHPSCMNHTFLGWWMKQQLGEG